MNEILLLETNKQVFFNIDYIENETGWVDTFISKYGFKKPSYKYEHGHSEAIASIYDLHLVIKKPYEEFKNYYAKNVRSTRNK